MSESEEHVFKIVCPCCRTAIWVDAAAQGVLKTEKAAKARQSLDDLLSKEKKKVEGMATKFESTAELERLKKKTAEEMFKKALGAKGEAADSDSD